MAVLLTEQIHPKRKFRYPGGEMKSEMSTRRSCWINMNSCIRESGSSLFR